MLFTVSFITKRSLLLLMKITQKKWLKIVLCLVNHQVRVNKFLFVGCNENNFMNYFEKFSKERYSKMYSDSDDEDNLENFQKDFSDLSSNLKQFLKKKKDSSSRYILSN